MQYSKASDLLEKALTQILNPEIGPKLPWMPKFSEYLGGMRPHEVTLLCAGTGTGKTALLASITAQLIEQGIPVFAAPVETGDVDFLIRVISALAHKDLNLGEPWNPDVLKPFVMKQIDRLSQSNLFIAHYDNRVKIEELKEVLEFAHRSHRIQVAILDNLNFFLEVVATTMEKAEMDFAIHELVMFSKRFPMHTLLVVHPKKTENGRVLSEFDIKGSSTSVQECANVLLFNRIDEKERLENNFKTSDREFVFRKIRKRGMHVGKKFYMDYTDGVYQEFDHEVK